MSRSYKHTPVYKCTFGRDSKVFANRRIRRCHVRITNGGSYVKYNPQYDIVEYRSFFTYKMHLEQQKRIKEECNLAGRDVDPWLQHFYSDAEWMKYYYRK